jgi:tetratricopeptide (TPR) repeat protein
MGLGHELLASAGDQPRVLLALAELAVDRDFWHGTREAGDALDAARAAADPAIAWEVELLATYADYFSTIVGRDGTIRIGAGQHDAATIAGLTDRARRVYETAPPDARGGWAAFWRGVIADNVAGDPEPAQPWYAEALARAEQHGDDALAAEALRHQGGHARRLGDHERARRLWERSTKLRQRAGLVPGTLSQLLALATNAADIGDTGRAAAIATEVRRWAAALGVDRLATQASRVSGAG